jgi:type II secretory pathway component GspD/PulD (secretin)
MYKRWIIYSQILLIIFVFAITCYAQDESLKTEPLLTLSCKDADVRDVLRGIAIQYGVNIVPDRNVTGGVTIHLQDAPFESGLNTLLDTNGFEYENRDGIYLVHLKDADEIDLQISFQDGKVKIDAENTDIKRLLREFSIKTGLNIVAESGLTGTATVHLSNVSAEEALYAFLTANGFIIAENSGIYRVRSGGLDQGSSTIFYRNGKITIDVDSVPIMDVLSTIAKQGDINLTIIGDLKESITMRLDSVDLDLALQLLTEATGNAYKIIDGVYIVGDPTVRPGKINPLLEREIVWLKYMEAEDAFAALPSDISKASVTVSPDRNALILLGTREIIEQLKGIIRQIDIENPDIRSRLYMAMSVEVDDDGLLTIDAKDAPISMLLREISIRKGIDMTILSNSGGDSPISSRILDRRQRGHQQQTSPAPASEAPTRQRASSRSSISGSSFSDIVNFRISKATLQETFDALFKGTPYTYKREVEGDREFYIVGTGELLPGGGNPLVVSKKISLRYLNAADILSILPVTIPDININIIEEQNAIVIMGTQTMIDELQNYITQIDSPVPQVMIEALLIEITNGNERDLGINWSWQDVSERNMVQVAPGLSAAFDSLAGVPDNFFAALNALVSENKARVLAKPRVATTNGLQASINVGWTDYFETTTEIYRGDDIPIGGYTRRGFNTLESGITLEITPWIGAAGDITVLIHPDIKDAKQVSKEHSTIANRSLDTTIRVKDGDTIVIGGLIQRNEIESEKKVPVLGSIPVLGHLFKESQKTNNDTELIIVVKPMIIGGSED